MKLLLLAGLIFSINISAKAVDVSHSDGDCKACAGEFRGAVGLEESVQKIARKVAKVDVNKSALLASRICGEYSSSGESIVTDIKQQITSHMKKYEGISSPSKGQIIQFLNKNRHQMNCGDDKNFLKHAFDQGRHNAVIEELFGIDMASKGEYIDFNAVDFSSGNPETVLDYIDGMIASGKHSDSFIEEVEDLREMMVEDLGAKHYKNLTKSEKEEAMKYKPE